MGHSHESRKEQKKKATKTLSERRAAKRERKHGAGHHEIKGISVD